MPGGAGKKEMRIFKNAWFQRFSIREKISDETLKEAVNRVQRGLIDSDLGGNVLKQRIAKPGQGKSGVYRTIILFKKGERAFLFSDLQRTSGQISTMRKPSLLKRLLKSCFPSRMNR